jgi:hypothetical protein
MLKTLRIVLLPDITKLQTHLLLLLVLLLLLLFLKERST